MRPIRNIVARFIAVWFIEGVSLLLANYLVPGIVVIDTPETPHLTIAMSVALVLAVVNALVRPILLLVTLPLNVLTFGLTTLLINASVLGITAWLLPTFQIRDAGSAVLGALVLTVANTILSSLTSIDDDNSFYDGMVQWLSRRLNLPSAVEPGRGIVVLEIDGLSYQRMVYAVQAGIMPNVAQMLREGTHRLSHFDCGLPSQTSSAQAGIMYGDNYDIPAFRWYEKTTGRMIVSNRFDDAAALDARYAGGNGLLRGGSSINNLMAGDATKRLLTLSALRDPDEEAARRRNEDLYLFWLNPYIFARSVILTVWDLIVELFEAARQRALDVQPRINRFQKAYPVLRALANVFLRELGTYMVILDIIRGVPAIYTTYVGYDEVAHHAGPDSPDALHTLRALDRSIGRVRDVIQRKAGRPYDLFILSDHGQSAGAPFRQRYGMTLAQLIESLVTVRTSAPTGSDTGQYFVGALAAELRAATLQRPDKRRRDQLRNAALGRTGRALERQLSASPDSASNETAPPVTPPAMQAPVIVCAGGNLAHAYFNLKTSKVNLGELQAAYPGLVDALVRHPGIGFVVAYDDDGTPIALGKTGAHNLVTGAVTGIDPLAVYGDPDLRAEQLLRLAEFPNSGDLIINSTLYPDGQVAAFEELVGSHGGLGGQQTDAFLLHPADMAVPAISNTAELFGVLNGRRGLPGEPLKPSRPIAAEDQSWTRPVLASGLRNWRVWMQRTISALLVDWRVYREVAGDPYATGPALALGLTTSVVAGITVTILQAQPNIPDINAALGIGSSLIAWIISIATAQLTCWALGMPMRFTPLMRALAFASTPLLLTPLILIPGIGPVLGIGVVMVRILMHWIALSQVIPYRGRAGWLIAGLVMVLSAVLAVLVLLALSISLDALMVTINTITQIGRPDGR
ncbi:MAG: phage holin family protein [Anaerolineae bacterium]|nr:phage holin family protein [Thermoflexales bacterium]MDW8407012.1 phage holin family protein [Anaerolineae bacterium]